MGLGRPRGLPGSGRLRPLHPVARSSADRALDLAGPAAHDVDAAACAALAFTIEIGVTSVRGARDPSASESDLPTDQ